MTDAYNNFAAMLLEDYHDLPRDKEMSGDKNVQTKSEKELAIQEVRKLLDFLEKKVTDRLTDQDKALMKEKIDVWEKSIIILKEALL